MAGEHGGVDAEVEIVALIKGVESVLDLGITTVAIVTTTAAVTVTEVIDAAVTAVKIRKVFGISANSIAVTRYGALVIATQYVEMSRHVEQVSSVGDQGAKVFGDGECGFGGGRHFHQMDVEVKQTRVL